MDMRFHNKNIMVDSGKDAGYARRVLDVLESINNWDTGRWLTWAIGTLPGKTLRIIKCMHPSETSAEPDGMRYGDASPKGQPAFVVHAKTQDIVTGNTGTGRGISAHIWFTPDHWNGSRGPGSRPDEVLIHEMVHALRMMEGKTVGAVTKGIGNFDLLEEFFAVLFANIFMSEKAAGSVAPLRLDHHKFAALANPDQFLNSQLNRDWTRQFARDSKWWTDSIAKESELFIRFNPLRNLN
jgi:hypothetical protein